jgi:putative sigma-54 modulation protein
VRISLVERTGHLSDAAKDYARDKAGKLNRFYDRLEGVEVIIGHESRRFNVEMVAKTDHSETFVASEAHEDLYASVDLVMDKMERQLVKHKERLRNRKHPEGS